MLSVDFPGNFQIFLSFSKQETRRAKNNEKQSWMVPIRVKAKRWSNLEVTEKDSDGKIIIHPQPETIGSEFFKPLVEGTIIKS